MDLEKRGGKEENQRAEAGGKRAKRGEQEAVRVKKAREEREAVAGEKGVELRAVPGNRVKRSREGGEVKERGLLHPGEYAKMLGKARKVLMAKVRDR